MRDLILAGWRYRYFILSGIQAELFTRFARSKLGGLWAIIHPLAQAAILAIVFAEIMSARLPGLSDNKFAYSIYLMAGIACWSLFADVVTRSLSLFIDNGSLLKRVVFPRITLPLIASGSALLNNLLLLGAIVLLFGLLGHLPGPQAAWLPVLLMLTLAFGLGLGLVLGVLNVFVRDIAQVVPVVLQLGFWLTPIVYTPDILPPWARLWLSWSPIYWLVQGYQNAILFDRSPPLAAIGLIAFVSTILLVLALMVFRRASREMVDLL